MSFIEVVAGQRQSWGLVKKLGEGDAGEVFLVESLLERSRAILKRPCRSSLASDSVRQGSQINSEGNILKALSGMSISKEGVTVRTPALLDRSLQKIEYGTEVFIVIGKAPGFDLRTLARYARFGKPESSSNLEDDLRPEEERFLKSVAELQSVPEIILLRTLNGLFDFLKKIHTSSVVIGDEKAAGILWNDVKPEHLYWDPGSDTLTIVDWGNARLLEADGGTHDRMFSRRDDVHQYLKEMGKLLEDTNPGLTSELVWPSDSIERYESFDEIFPLQDNLLGALSSALEKLRQARQAEADLSYLISPDLSVLETLAKIQEQIFRYGAYSDQGVVEVVYSRLASQLISEKKFDEFREICTAAGALAQENPQTNSFRWKLLNDISALASSAPDPSQEHYFAALQAGLEGDWPSVLWHLLIATRVGPVPEWWEEISQQMRQAFLGADGNVLAPYLAASRAFYTLQARVVYGTGSAVKYPMPSKLVQEGPSIQPQSYENLLRSFESDVIRKWKELEPDPPNAGIEYNDVQGMLEDLEQAVPGIRDGLDKALEQPGAQVQIILDAWRRMDFDTARRGLRILLLWDPHRRRLLTADRAISSASRWLVRVRTGIRNGDSLQDFLPQVELAGRELRSQVGSAPWLDSILDALKKLRSGVKPADLIMEHPELLTTIPWLNNVRAQETLSLPRTKPLSIERGQGSSLQNVLSGAREGKLGPGCEISLAEPLDIWVPEALGSSARVFNGVAAVPQGESLSLAFKVMRPNRIEYALPLFKEEASILTIMHDVPGVSRIVECGFIQLDNGQELPVENRNLTASELSGVIKRYGINEVQNFLISLDRHVEQGWIPYMALEKRNLKHNLMIYCDAALTRGRFLPLRENLLLGIQICDIIQFAHDRNVAYRDHKILHYFWNPAVQCVEVIDWNIAKRYPQGMPPVERQFDVVQFGARALHHILTGRAAPGTLPLGPNMLQDVEQAAHTYNVQWTYDDERLPNRVKEILEKVLGEGYQTIRELRQDLVEVFEQLPESGPASA